VPASRIAFKDGASAAGIGPKNVSERVLTVRPPPMTGSRAEKISY
jgi:hypothetical protein